MKNECTTIHSDVFDISKRLKEIDSGYYAVYNHKYKRFEVHNRLQRGGSFCLAVPYLQLDARTVTLVRRTRAERAAAYLAEMEEENIKIEKMEKSRIQKNAERQMEDCLR